MEATFAAHANVTADAVTVTVSAGSVVVTAKIVHTSNASAAAAAASLSVALATPALATAFFAAVTGGVAVISRPVVLLETEQVVSQPAPSSPPASDGGLINDGRLINDGLTGAEAVGLGMGLLAAAILTVGPALLKLQDYLFLRNAVPLPSVVQLELPSVVSASADSVADAAQPAPAAAPPRVRGVSSEGEAARDAKPVMGTEFASLHVRARVQSERQELGVIGEAAVKLYVDQLLFQSVEEFEAEQREAQPQGLGGIGHFIKGTGSKSGNFLKDFGSIVKETSENTGKFLNKTAQATSSNIGNLGGNLSLNLGGIASKVPFVGGQILPPPSTASASTLSNSFQRSTTRPEGAASSFARAPDPAASSSALSSAAGVSAGGTVWPTLLTETQSATVGDARIESPLPERSPPPTLLPSVPPEGVPSPKAVALRDLATSEKEADEVEAQRLGGEGPDEPKWV